MDEMIKMIQSRLNEVRLLKEKRLKEKEVKVEESEFENNEVDHQKPGDVTEESFLTAPDVSETQKNNYQETIDFEEKCEIHTEPPKEKSSETVDEDGFEW